MTQAVIWSPDLHNIVRSLMKMERREIINLQSSGKLAPTKPLSEEEEQAVIAAFSKPIVQQVTPTFLWG